MATKKSWLEKLNASKEPVVKRLDSDFADMPAGSTMLIASPKIIEDYIRHIAKGISVDIKTMRQDLAGAYHADYTCPVTTGIFLRIVAEANYEKIQQGEPIKKVAPFWRAIKPDSPLAKKLSFGQEFLIKQIEKESA